MTTTNHKSIGELVLSVGGLSESETGVSDFGRTVILVLTIISSSVHFVSAGGFSGIPLIICPALTAFSSNIFPDLSAKLTV